METNASGAERFRLGDWLVDPPTNRLYRGTEQVRLEPKVMAVLVYLAQRPGKTISRAELESAVWSGTVVGYDSVTGAIQKLRKVLDDRPSNPRFIETLSKKGYRLIAPVTPVPPEAARPETSPKPRVEARNDRLLQASVAIVSILLLLTAAAVWLTPTDSTTTDSGVPGPKTVAVLPFRNLNADPARDYFAEGLSDDLIASLSRYGDLQVIARDSSALYKEAEMDNSDVAETLDVRYLVQGGVRRDGDRVRINVRLVDGPSSEVLWSERFDASGSELFELQDRLTHRMVVALIGRMNVRDRQELGRPRTDSLQAYEHFLYGRQQFFLYAGAEENRKSRESFRSALSIDPEFAMAYAMLAWTHAFDAMNGWGESRRESLKLARELATKAIELDAVMPVAHFVRGLAYRELGDRTRALVEAEKAIALDPNYAGAYVLQATLMYFDGHPQRGVELTKTAIALNPHHPFNYSFHLGQAYYILHRYDEAIEAFARVLESNPAAERVHLWLAAAYAQAGRLEDAGWEIEQVRMTDPDLSLERIRDAYPFTDPSDRDHLLAGLRTAGWAD